MAAKGLQPKDLFPSLDPGAENVDGAVAVAGSASWKSGAFRSDANLLVRDLSFERSGVRVERLNGVVAVDNLVPLSTKPDQRLAVAAVQVGVPLTDGLFTFEVRDGRVLDIRDARLKLADGQVSVSGVTLSAGQQRQLIPLQVTGVDLGLLLDLAGLDGLTGSGRLSGTIPVILAGSDVEITGGELTAREPGRIGYDPASPPAALKGGGEQVALALLALKDFHYDRLQVTLDRKLGGETVIGMHIAGRNPDFYDGYPVEFNLNLTGKLDQILRRGLASYRLPDEIRKRLESFPPDPLKSP
jgi:hypothetical protein